MSRRSPASWSPACGCDITGSHAPAPERRPPPLPLRAELVVSPIPERPPPQTPCTESITQVHPHMPEKFANQIQRSPQPQHQIAQSAGAGAVAPVHLAAGDQQGTGQPALCAAQQDAAQLHRPGQPDHEAPGGVPPGVQRPARRRRGAPGHRGSGADQPAAGCRAPGADGGTHRAQHRGDAAAPHRGRGVLVGEQRRGGRRAASTPTSQPAGSSTASYHLRYAAGANAPIGSLATQRDEGRRTGARGP